MDADGAETTAVQGTVDFVDPTDRLEITATLVVNFDNLTFDHYGPLYVAGPSDRLSGELPVTPRA